MDPEARDRLVERSAAPTPALTPLRFNFRLCLNALTGQSNAERPGASTYCHEGSISKILLAQRPEGFLGELELPFYILLFHCDLLSVVIIKLLFTNTCC